MNIKWLGHSCFLISSKDGKRIFLDPCDRGTGYDIHDIDCDVLLISHSHHDHNNVSSATGNYKLIDKIGEYDLGDIKIKGIKTYHDKESGSKRGENIVFIIDIDGKRLVHMGDYGESLSEEFIKELGKVDIMLIPVGGVYTIDAKEACDIIDRVKPCVVIPMHYKTSALTFSLGDVSEFTSALEGYEIIKAESDIETDDIESGCVIMKYEGEK